MTVFSGDFTQTLVVGEELLALGRETNNLWAIAFALLLQSVAAMNGLGTMEVGARLASEAQVAAIAAGDPWLEGLALMFLALTAQYTHDYENASRLYDECLRRFRPTGDKWAIAMALNNLASLRVVQGHDRQAKILSAEAIVSIQELSDHRGTAWCLEVFAAVAAAGGDARRAGLLWGASDRLLELVGSPLQPAIQSFRDSYFGSARELLGAGAFQAALSEGRGMSLAQAVQYALAETS
jgi:non-specific serine/threonine protein kinase